jgi:Tfp pilus assembly protein PilP
MKKILVLIVVLLLSACDVDSSQAIPNYEELKNYPVDCNKKELQLAHLHLIQKRKNFDEDPDKLALADYYYNSRLKSTIWWFYYECGDK